jgi:hypothetical protein
MTPLHARNEHRAQGERGMSLVEVLVGVAMLGLTTLAFMQGQQMVGLVAKKQATRSVLWSLEREVRNNAYARMRDTVLASFDPANKCTPCETSPGEGHRCKQLALAMSEGMRQSAEGLPRYSTELRIMDQVRVRSSALTSDARFKEVLGRCAKQTLTKSGLGPKDAAYGCFQIAPAMVWHAVQEQRAGQAVAAAQGTLPPGTIIGASADQVETDLERFLKSRTVVAEVSYGFYDQARGREVSCKEFGALSPGDRSLRMFYTLHTWERRDDAGIAMYDRVKGAMQGRADPSL